MMQNALKYELLQMFPDWKCYFVEPDSTDECPPYFTVNLVDGAPAGSGESGRWQITIVHNDKDVLQSEIYPAVKAKFHDQSGMFGEQGKEIAIRTSGIVRQGPATKGENEGVYFKQIDLKLSYC